MEDNNFSDVKRQFIVSGAPPFGCCHASTIARLSNEAYFAAWFAGSVEGADDVNIWGAKYSDGSWSAPKIIMSGEQPHWNPVLFADNDGRLLLFYKVGKLISAWQTLLSVSHDGGRCWSRPVELVAGDFGGRGPVRNKAICLSDGSLLAPASTEDGVHWRSFADKSVDGAKTWHRSKDISIASLDVKQREAATAIPVSDQSFHGRGVIQPTLWESESGVHMLMRSTEGFIHRSDSTDGGKTWTNAYPIGLPNNNSGIDLVCTPNHTLYLVCNPIGENWGKRTPLVLLKSMDDGASWEQCMTLEDDEGEYSYPAIICEDNKLLITYTWKRKNIAFWQLQIR